MVSLTTPTMQSRGQIVRSLLPNSSSFSQKYLRQSQRILSLFTRTVASRQYTKLFTQLRRACPSDCNSKAIGSTRLAEGELLLTSLPKFYRLLFEYIERFQFSLTKSAVRIYFKLFLYITSCFLPIGIPTSDTRSVHQV